MKIAILGAGGVRTPLIVASIIRRQERLGIAELALMDIDGPRLDLIGALTAPLEDSSKLGFKISRTTQAEQALDSADFVITTFRVGGIASRAIDERIPLDQGILGQETTGPGGFAMGLRTIPVLLGYLEQMRAACPQAWLINFANPAGMVTEAATRIGGWERSVGICDAPGGMGRVAAALLKAQPEDLYLDYFGLNHLGWLRSVLYQGKDHLPDFIANIRKAGGFPLLPFDADLISALGMIPNEYLYYYYYSRQAVRNILDSGKSRGEQLADLNQELFSKMASMLEQGRQAEMPVVYQAYLEKRSGTYMERETGKQGSMMGFEELVSESMVNEGYAGVALDLIEGLSGVRLRTMILNVANQGAIMGMDGQDVVEVPCFVGQDLVRPLSAGAIPDHCLGLMKQVKAYERLAISAAVEGSYEKALLALTIHPLVSDVSLARAILEGYITGHGDFFPVLNRRD